MIINKDTKIFRQYGLLGYGDFAESHPCDNGYFSYNEIKEEYDKRVAEYEADGLIKGVHWDGYFNERWIEENNNSPYEFDYPLCELHGHEVDGHEDEVPRNECVQCNDKDCDECMVKIGVLHDVDLAKYPTWSWDVTATNEDAGCFENAEEEEDKIHNFKVCYDISNSKLIELYNRCNKQFTEDSLERLIDFMNEVLPDKINKIVTQEVKEFISKL